jgi:hypothetical protein
VHKKFNRSAIRTREDYDVVQQKFNLRDEDYLVGVSQILMAI